MLQCISIHTQASSFKAIKIISVESALSDTAIPFSDETWLEVDLMLSKQWAAVFFPISMMDADHIKHTYFFPSPTLYLFLASFL